MTYAQDALEVDATFRADGQLFTFSLKQPGTYSGGAVVAGAPVPATAWGIETSVTSRDLGMGNLPGSLVKVGDKKLLVSTLTDAGAALPVPQVDDSVKVGSKVYTVKNVDTLQPGGVPVMHTIVVRA